MMSDIPKMREYIRNAYPGPNWRRKCDSMSTSQVIAVYRSIKAREGSKKKKAADFQKPEGQQLSIWEFL